METAARRRSFCSGGVRWNGLVICALSRQKVEEVCTTLLDPPFQSCHEFVSPLSYMAGCSNDLCL